MCDGLVITYLLIIASAFNEYFITLTVKILLITTIIMVMTVVIIIHSSILLVEQFLFKYKTHIYNNPQL